jgi:hypothetical protein
MKYSSWPQDGRCKLICLLTSVTNHTVQKLFSFSTSLTPACTHISYPFSVPQLASATYLSSIYVKNNMNVGHFSQSVGFEYPRWGGHEGEGEKESPFIIQS